MGNFLGSAYAVTAIPTRMGGVAESQPPEKAVRLCCVLVHAEGDPPPRLSRALSAKQIEFETTRNIYAALTELCALSRDPSVALPILAIVEPERIERAADLYRAASVYAPDASLWVYTAAPHEQIREVREADLAAWSQASEPGKRGDAGVSGPETGPAVSGSVEPKASGHHDVGEKDSGPLLTDEELEMLLSDDLPEEES